MTNDATRGDEEIRRLQGFINALISIQALPAIWNKLDSSHIVSTLLEALVSVLRLDFAYARLSDSADASAAEMVRLAQRRAQVAPPQEIGRALDRWLTPNTATAPLSVPNPVGDGEVTIIPVRLGLLDEIGVLVAGSKRADFPTQTETLLLRVAANQALVALQEARQLNERKRAAEELERRVVERTEALRASEQKYRTLFDSMDEGFCTLEVLFDANEKPMDLRVLEVNPAFEKQTGIQNVRGKRVRELILLEDHWFEIYGRIALTGEPTRFKNEAATLRRCFDVYAFRIGEPQERKVAAFFQDVTERKHAEERLREYEKAVENLEEMIVVVDRDYRYRLANLAFLTYRDLEREQLIGHRASELVPPKAWEVAKNKLDEALQGSVVKYELRYEYPKLGERDLFISYFPIEGPDGIDRVVCVLRDITERKKAEETLRASEARFRSYFELGLIGMAMTSPTKGILEVNDELCRILGYDRSELLQKTWAGMTHPEDLAADATQFHRVMAGEIDGYTLDKRWLCKEGRVIDSIMAAKCLRRADGSVDYFVGLVLDTTERKRAEKELRRNDMYLAEGQRLSHTASWAWNVATGEVYWSPEHFRIFGLDPGKTKPSRETLCEMVHPNDWQRTKETFDQAARERTDYEAEYRIVRPDGAIRHLHVLGHPVVNGFTEYVGTVMDITERKHAEEDLRRSEAFLAEGQRISHTGSWGVKFPSCDMFWSQEMFRIYDLDPATTKLSLELAFELIHPEDRVFVREEFERAVREKSDYTVEHRSILSDGSLKYVHALGRPLLDEFGAITEYVGTAVDITDRKSAEEELRKTQDELAQVTRVSTIGELAASIAHEINQPLGAIINNSNACVRLFGKRGTQKEIRETLTDIVSDANRASGIITSIRALARRTPPERTSFSLKDVVADTLALARHTLTQWRIILRTELAEDLPRIPEDRVQIQQVLLNLVMNAIEAMSDVEQNRRVMTITGQSGELEGKSVAVISVQDFGIGFKTEDKERLFHPFYTTKSHGMGMGLRISRSIVDAHGGRLWATTNAGPGATFACAFPAEEKL